MRTILGLLLLGTAGVNGYAAIIPYHAAHQDVNAVISQEPDSVEYATELDGVTVEASGRKMTVEGASVIPNSKQKNVATDGYDLVRMLGIPQLIMQPGSEEIRNMQGKSVSTYINYVAASQSDVLGLDPKSVVKVEYLTFPQDPRFGGQQYVVNYIVKQPDYGGYTRLTGSGPLYAFPSTNFSGFSKFYSGKMTYDLYAGYTYSNTHHNGSDISQWYTLTDPQGNEYEQLREETTELYKSRSHWLPLSLRVSYVKDRLQIINNVSYTWSETPSTINSGLLHFSPGAESDYRYWRSNNSRGNSVSWNGNYFIPLPRDFSLSIAPRFTYSHYNNGSAYITSIPGSQDLLNDSRDDAYTTRADINLYKTWGDRFSLGLLGIFFYSHNNVEYMGSYPSHNSMNVFGGSGNLDFRARLNNFNLSMQAGIIDDNTEVNGMNIHKVSPRFVANVNWMINPNQMLGFYAQYATYTPPIGDKSPNVLRQNEFLYISGNPDYRTMDFIETNLSYSWMVNNHFTASSAVSYDVTWKPGQIVYEPYEAGSAILRQPVNSGVYKNLFAYIMLRYAPTQSLSFDGYVRYGHQGLEGINHTHVNFWGFYITANYYFRNFYASVTFERTDKSMQGYSGVIQRWPNFFVFNLGWAAKGWNVRVDVRNPFKYTWCNGREYFSSPWYRYEGRTYGTNAHCSVQLRVSYTFRYGKQRNDHSEIGAGSQAQSGVLQ